MILAVVFWARALAIVVLWPLAAVVTLLVRALCLIADQFTGLDSYGEILCGASLHQWEIIGQYYPRTGGALSYLWQCSRCGERRHVDLAGNRIVDT